MSGNELAYSRNTLRDIVAESDLCVVRHSEASYSAPRSRAWNRIFFYHPVASCTLSNEVIKWYVQVFFTLWCLSVVWFTTLVVNKREVHNWFRMPCRMSSATVVHVWAQDQQEILSINVTALVHFVRKVKVRTNQILLLYFSASASPSFFFPNCVPTLEK